VPLNKDAGQARDRADDAFDRGDYDAAVAELRPLAEGGDEWAQCNLAYLYETGRGVEQNVAEAAQWYLKAAKQGDTEAQVSLGTYYEDGQGVKRNYGSAVRWYRKAAEQDDA